MRINIVCTDNGWIYSKFIEMFRKYSKHEILINSKDKCDITHYLPYYELTKQPEHPSTSWQSHQEQKEPLRSMFVRTAQLVDIPISHSKKYMDILKNEHGISSAIQIIPGVDLKVFKRRSTDRPDNRKLVVGYIGRMYQSSNRKNPGLLEKISKLDFVELKITGGKVKDQDIPKFYEDLDVVVSPATVEGGPMAIQESLAVGTPIICFEGVGVEQEFSTGLIKVPFGDTEDFLSRLETIWMTKSYLHWRDPSIMNQIRAQVKDQSWMRFVRKHELVWESII